VTDPGDLEFGLLSTETGRALLAEVGRIATPGPADLTRWRNGRDPECVAAACRLAEGRRKGARKFERAGSMWLDPVGVEQATSEPVARHKAVRFAGHTVVDLCSGVGGDAVAMASVADVLAIDADRNMGRRTRWNAEIYEVHDRLLAVHSRAERFARPEAAWVHVDPDRRAAADRSRNRSRRPTSRVAEYAPGLGFLLAMVDSAPAGAIKLGPASDFAGSFGGPAFEIELVSLHGECKEATVWFGEAVKCRRRATRLPDGATWTDRDAPIGAPAAPAAPGPILFEPDPALIRAGLVEPFAAAHGLRRFETGVDYLAGETRLRSPWLAGFEVLAVVPFDEKRLRREVAARHPAVVEVKVRGLDVRPELVRSWFKPGSGEPLTILLARGAGPPRAIVARRLTGATG
jgi:hypothetical protein